MTPAVTPQRDPRRQIRSIQDVTHAHVLTWSDAELSPRDGQRGGRLGAIQQHDSHVNRRRQSPSIAVNRLLFIDPEIKINLFPLFCPQGLVPLRVT